MNMNILKFKYHGNDYYNALQESYVKTILHSGLLLDEDVEVLLSQYQDNFSYDFPNYKPSCRLKLSIGVFLGGAILSRKYSSLWIFPSLFLTSAAALIEIRNIQETQSQRQIMEHIVGILKSINQLNKAMIKYMKSRIEIENKSQTHYFKSYNSSIKKYISTIYMHEKVFLNHIMKTLGDIASGSEILLDDFSSIKDFNPLQEHQEEINTIEKSVTSLQQIHDIHIWLSSKLLSYIGIGLNLPANINDLQDILHFLEQHYKLIKLCFHSTRSSITKISKCGLQRNTPQISNRLQSTLLSAIDNIALISEKSQGILEEIDNSKTEPSKELEDALLDLKNHTYATYESLNLLCRLYGILSSQKLPTTISVQTPKKPHEGNVVSIHHDDNIDIIEENFELYIDKDYSVQKDTSTRYSDDSGAYLSLMLQELRESLKKHDRFIEAKRRRGSIDQEQQLRVPESIQQFNLNVLTSQPFVDVDGVNSNTETSVDASLSSSPPYNVNEEPRSFITPSHNLTKSQNIATLQPPNVIEKSSIPTPPGVIFSPIPPPPPLQVRSFFLEDCDTGPSKSMLESIKVLSGQLDRQEEVFEDSDDNSDNI